MCYFVISTMTGSRDKRRTLYLYVTLEKQEQMPLYICVMEKFAWQFNLNNHMVIRVMHGMMMSSNLC